MVHGGAVCRLQHTFTSSRKARPETAEHGPLKDNRDCLCVHRGFANKVPRFKSWLYLLATHRRSLAMAVACKNQTLEAIIFYFIFWRRCEIIAPPIWPNGFSNLYPISVPAPQSSTRKEGLRKWPYRMAQVFSHKLLLALRTRYRRAN